MLELPHCELFCIAPNIYRRLPCLENNYSNDRTQYEDKQLTWDKVVFVSKIESPFYQLTILEHNDTITNRQWPSKDTY